jgi:hypothetical protein
VESVPKTSELDSGVGAGFVPRGWIVAMTIALLLLAAVALYTLWAFWPVGLQVVSQNPERRKASYFGADLRVSTEALYFGVVALAGALGGLVHTVRSFSMYVGTRKLLWSWVPFNLLLPVVGALGGTLFYLVFRAGLFSSSTTTSSASPYGFAAIAALVGLFSEQAVEKLRQIAQQMFTEAPKFEPDHFEPAAAAGTAAETHAETPPADAAASAPH